MTRYAQNTSVNTTKSKAEIERTLTRYGAEQFMYGWSSKEVLIGFRLNGIMVQFNLPLPFRSDPKFTKTPTGKIRTENAAYKEWEKGVRQGWRALALIIKAKFVAIDSGIRTFEQEFLADIMLPDGTTVGKFMLPQIKKAYESGKMPVLLLES